MSIIDPLANPIKEFLFKIALKKGITSLAKFIVSFLLAHSIKIVGVYQGVVIDTTSEIVIAGFINSGLKMLVNWFKTKFPNHTLTKFL